MTTMWKMKKMRKRGRHCPHSDLRPIYGDEVNHVGGWRLQCRTCGRFLDGPVTLAGSRQGEADMSRTWGEDGCTVAAAQSY